MGVKTVRLTFHSHAARFEVEDSAGRYQVECGLDKWKDGTTAMPGTPPKLTRGKLPSVSKVAASGVWKDEHTFEMIWQFFETPHHDKVICSFAGQELRVEFLDSITAMSAGKKDKRPVLVGQMA